MSTTLDETHVNLLQRLAEDGIYVLAGWRAGYINVVFVTSQGYNPVYTTRLEKCEHLNMVLNAKAPGPGKGLEYAKLLIAIGQQKPTSLMSSLNVPSYTNLSVPSYSGTNLKAVKAPSKGLGPILAGVSKYHPLLAGVGKYHPIVSGVSKYLKRTAGPTTQPKQTQINPSFRFSDPVATTAKELKTKYKSLGEEWQKELLNPRTTT